RTSAPPSAPTPAGCTPWAGAPPRPSAQHRLSDARQVAPRTSRAPARPRGYPWIRRGTRSPEASMDWSEVRLQVDIPEGWQRLDGVPLLTFEAASGIRMRVTPLRYPKELAAEGLA